MNQMKPLPITLWPQYMAVRLDAHDPAYSSDTPLGFEPFVEAGWVILPPEEAEYAYCKKGLPRASLAQVGLLGGRPVLLLPRLTVKFGDMVAQDSILEIIEKCGPGKIVGEYKFAKNLYAIEITQTGNVLDVVGRFSQIVGVTVAEPEFIEAIAKQRQRVAALLSAAWEQGKENKDGT